MHPRGRQQERLAALLGQSGESPSADRGRGPGVSARHCWVIDPEGWPGTWPGLLHEWRRTGSGWTALVTMAVLHDGRQVIVQVEIPASHLRPLE